MKYLLLALGLLGTGQLAHGQRRPKVFMDSVGAPTTYERYWGIVLDGRYQSARNKATNTYRLAPLPAAEFAQAKAATAKRILVAKKLGQPLPAFRVTDYRGRVFDTARLRGKVLVLNFWFVGCPPCEMEIASLNRLHARYQADTTVVFLSLVRSKPAEVTQFLASTPFSYPVAELTPALLAQLKPSAYPTNLVIDQQGHYAFESVGAGVGSTVLLAEAIATARR